jgi:hypothetical protein
MSGIPLEFCGNSTFGYFFSGWNTLSFTAIGSQYNLMMQAPRDQTVTHIGFNLNTRTGTPGTLTFKLTDVDATGNPGTTVYATTTISSDPTVNTFLNYAGATGAISWIPLGTTVSVTRGQWLCATIICAAGTWTASTQQITINYQLQNSNEAHGNRGNTPYASRGSARQDGFVGGFRNATQAFGYPISSLSSDTYSFTGTRYGWRFTVPSGMGASVRLCGVRFRAGINTASNVSFIAGPISGSTVTESLSYSYDTDFQSGAPVGYAREIMFPTPLTLTAGSEYVIGLNAGADNVQFGNAKLTAAVDRSAFVETALFGNARCGSWVSNTWTDDDTRLYLMTPMIDLVTASSGGSSIDIPIGMTGGMRG